MTNQLDAQLLSEYRDSFSLFDKNGDGVIDSSELGQVMRSLGHSPSAEELKDMIDDLDSDHNGYVDFNEFLVLMSRVKGSEETENDLIDAFKVFDKDKDGYITHDELRSVMSQLGDVCQHLSQEELDQMIYEADVDGDGRINYKEFGKMMTAK
ncbi:calmodulin [Gilbertella persicaria]|uniref:calmodulin n=1 Tax=Gilbertella persicaria TaxID=101096 RepID=UPI002220BE4A|nr:calmodulin [Gilbertella persicaria]KAI8087753.1 calmodulin [Gilbertella persicaria]